LGIFYSWKVSFFSLQLDIYGAFLRLVDCTHAAAHDAGLTLIRVRVRRRRKVEDPLAEKLRRSGHKAASLLDPLLAGLELGQDKTNPILYVYVHDHAQPYAEVHVGVDPVRRVFVLEPEPARDGVVAWGFRVVFRAGFGVI
jgi:hypothetical protein